MPPSDVFRQQPMLRRTTMLLLLAAVAGCAPMGLDGGADQPEPGEPEDAPRTAVSWLEHQTRAPDGDLAPPDAGATSAEDWDPTPPVDLPHGTVLVGSLTCGLFEGSAVKNWVNDGTAWLEQAGGSVTIRPEAAPCMAVGPKELYWWENGDIEFDSASWQHAFKPTATPGLWLGGGTPYHSLNAACLEGLSALGLDVPVTMSLQVLAVLPP